MFLPPSIQEWLPEQHLARFVVEIVEQLELSEITSRYAGSGGQRAYHPAMLVALLFYGYATGVFSSRKLVIMKGEKMALESFKMATVIIGVVPMLALYPFLQRFFIHGVYLGAVKG